MAKRWLAMRKTNRPVNLVNYNKVVKALTEGTYRLNGESIILSDDGILDGQHRLLAVVDTGVAMWSVVVYGIDSAYFATIDSGKVRGASDVLSIAGHLNTTVLGASLVVLWQIGRGTVMSKEHPPTVEIEGILAEHPWLSESVTFCKRKLPRMISPARLTAAHYVFSQHSRLEADRFIMDLHTGIGLKAGDPVAVLRDKIIRNTVANTKLPDNTMLALLIKAWNFRRGGKKIKGIHWRAASDATEDFPVAY
jgi:hypothetical protein